MSFKTAREKSGLTQRELAVELIFFDDDDFEHMSCSIEASWGKMGMTEIRICDYGDLKKCKIFC